VANTRFTCQSCGNCTFKSWPRAVKETERAAHWRIILVVVAAAAAITPSQHKRLRQQTFRHFYTSPENNAKYSKDSQIIQHVFAGPVQPPVELNSFPRATTIRENHDKKGCTWNDLNILNTHFKHYLISENLSHLVYDTILCSFPLSTVQLKAVQKSWPATPHLRLWI